MQTNKKIVHLNWTRSFNGDLILILKDIRIKLPCQDELGYTVYNGERIKMQDALDEVFNILTTLSGAKAFMGLAYNKKIG